MDKPPSYATSFPIFTPRVSLSLLYSYNFIIIKYIFFNSREREKLFYSRANGTRDESLDLVAVAHKPTRKILY